MKLYLNKLHDTQQLTKLLFFLRDIFPARLQEIVDLAADMSYGMTIELKPQKTNRSRPQENYYRKWVREFGKHVGLTPNELHEEILCIHFGSEEVDTPFGIKRRPIQRSNDSDRDEFTELIGTLIRVAAEMDFTIPEPRHDDA
jgi:DNA gyrase/topoisomerase IV subunit B